MYRSHSEVIILSLINISRCYGGIPDMCLSQANVDDRTEHRERLWGPLLLVWCFNHSVGAAMVRMNNAGSLRESMPPEKRLGNKRKCSWQPESLPSRWNKSNPHFQRGLKLNLLNSFLTKLARKKISLTHEEKKDTDLEQHCICEETHQELEVLGG